MAITLPSGIITEKNKLSSTGSWIILLELAFPSESTVYLAHNTEDVAWPDGDASEETYQAFPFELDDVEEDGKGGLPSFTIRVSNVGRALVSIIDQHAGAIGATATLRVVHSDHLDDTNPVFSESYTIISCSIDLQWATFTLGAENPLRQRSPRQRYLMDHCRYKEFKGTLCGYADAESSCDRTLKQCEDYGNSARFGGFPSISVGGGFFQ